MAHLAVGSVRHLPPCDQMGDSLMQVCIDSVLCPSRFVVSFASDRALFCADLLTCQKVVRRFEGPVGPVGGLSTAQMVCEPSLWLARVDARVL